MTETKQKRRWFRFSLRTMFVVVTIVGVGYGIFLFQKQASLVHQRHQFVVKLEEDAKQLKGMSAASAELSPLKNPDRTLSPIRRYLGDHNYSRLVLPFSYNQTDIDQAVALFSEAEIQHWEPLRPLGARYGGANGNDHQWISPVVIQEMK
jgi:hypothetical protein